MQLIDIEIKNSNAYFPK